MNKGLWELTWPLLLSMGLSISLNITDAFFLSRVSDEAASALGGLLPVLLICFSVFFALGQAGCAVAGQMLGAKRRQRALDTFGALTALHVVLGAMLSFALWALRTEIPSWLGLQSQIAAHAEVYLAWVGAAQVVRATQIAYVNILNALGATRWTMLEGVLMNVSNLGLNALFLSGAFGFDPALHGVRGVAWATVASMLLGLLLSMGVVHLKQHLRFQFELQASLRALRSIIYIGAPSALEPMAYHLSQMIIITFIVRLGPAALAARTYVSNLALLAVLWTAALGAAVQILVAHRIGEGRLTVADQQLRRGLLWGVLGAAGVSCGLLLLRYPALGLFTDSTEVLELAAPLFIVSFAGEVARPSNIIVGGALRSCGDARFTSLVGAAVMLGFTVPMAYVFGFVFDLRLIGIWLAIALDEALRGSINWLRWRSGAWKSRGVLQREAAT